MAIQRVASIAKAQLKADWFVSNPETEVGMKMHILSLNKLTIKTPHKYHEIAEIRNMKFEMVSSFVKILYFCLRHSRDSWGCDQNYNHIQGLKIAWHHHELINKTSCQSLSIKSIMVIIMN